MDNLTEEQWKKIIKKEGCSFNPLYKTRGEYANLALYMRVYISLLAKKNVFDDIEKVNRVSRFLDDYNKHYQELKKRHLSTFAKSKSDIINVKFNFSKGKTHDSKTFDKSP